MVYTEELTFVSDGDFYALNFTDWVREVLKASGLLEGSILVYCRHTTGVVLIIEHEVGILVDLQDVLDDIVLCFGRQIC